MPRKTWHVYVVRGHNGRAETGITNEPESLERVLYIEKCRDRTAALKREGEIKRLSRSKKISPNKAALSTRPVPDELPGKLYQVVNEGFVCSNCGAEVLPTEHDAPRNHCPFCLYSQHVDLQPGDRKNPCRGLLKPIDVENSGQKGYVIVYRCERCGETIRAKAALKSSVQPDDFDRIILVSRKLKKF